MIDSLAMWQGTGFRKASVSGANNCVEVAHGKAVFGIRDSKNAAGPVLALDESEGKAFLAAVKRFR
ncbi:DUF397 domain-containing protein [Actinophytocola glycyrrhizae]|uniref:DUF397 domain-containing protein n=1 Tax=Actinophytocola glycyrrhizae TaxID=2044873 RepID=A0ABV9RSY4_9PSEU